MRILPFALLSLWNRLCGGVAAVFNNSDPLILVPVLTEMVLWAAAHEDTGNQALVREMRRDKQRFLAGVRARWNAGQKRSG